MLNKFKQNLFKIEYAGELPKDLVQHSTIIKEEHQAITIQVEHENQSNDVLRHLINKGVYIHAFNEILPTLNEIFIQQVK